MGNYFKQQNQYAESLQFATLVTVQSPLEGEGHRSLHSMFKLAPVLRALLKQKGWIGAAIDTCPTLARSGMNVRQIQPAQRCDDWWRNVPSLQQKAILPESTSPCLEAGHDDQSMQNP